MRRAYPEARQPPSIRDFFAFEEHVATPARARAAGRCRPPGTRSRSSTSPTPARSTGDGDEVPKPADTAMLDYELELAAVIGTEGGSRASRS